MPEFTIELPEETVAAVEAEADDESVKAYLRETIEGSLDLERRNRAASEGSTVDTLREVTGFGGGSDADADDEEEDGSTVGELKQSLPGLGRDEPDRTETVEQLRELALSAETAEETTTEAIHTLASVGPQAESALAEIANSEVSSEIRQLALEQIRDINEAARE